MVRIRWYQRWWHVIIGWFSTEVRRQTAVEKTLTAQLQQARRELEDREAMIAHQEHELRRLQVDLELRDVEIGGLVLIIKRHEQHWEKEIAVEARRIARATMPSGR